MNEAKDFLYELIYYAFIEMRADAYEEGNKKVFYLCDLLHNLPAQLKNATESDYSNILLSIQTRVNGNKGLEKWLEEIKRNIENRNRHKVK